MTFNNSRLQKLQNTLDSKSVDVSIITNFKTVQYLTGFGSDPMERLLFLVMINNADPFLFVPALEEQVVIGLGWPYKVIGYQDNQDGMKMLTDEIKAVAPNAKNFGLEKDNINYNRAGYITSAFSGANFDFDVTPVVEHQKLYKEADEIEKLIQAGKDADAAFLAGTKALEVGKTELQIAAQLEFETKSKNIPEMSFGTLIQTADHAANPHGETSDRKLENNAMVLFDLGTVYQGYISDMSRTVALGTPTDHMKEVHQIVLEAQLKAVDAAKPGITAAELDQVARGVIEKAGLGEYFNHRLGHGVGMSEHEFPSIMAGNDMVIEPGMAFSIEPGVYIPNDLGVRIEDCVVITKDGNITLTNTSKELMTF